MNKRNNSAPSPKDTGSAEPPEVGRNEYTTWWEIPKDRRITNPGLVKVTNIKAGNSDKVSAILEVEDTEGNSFELKLWATHNINQQLSPGVWYVVEEARGSIWNQDGKIKRQLDSTKDLRIIPYSETSGEDTPNPKQGGDSGGKSTDPKPDGDDDDDIVDRLMDDLEFD